MKRVNRLILVIENDNNSLLIILWAQPALLSEPAVYQPMANIKAEASDTRHCLRVLRICSLAHLDNDSSCNVAFTRFITQY